MKVIFVINLLINLLKISQTFCLYKYEWKSTSVISGLQLFYVLLELFRFFKISLKIRKPKRMEKRVQIKYFVF